MPTAQGWPLLTAWNSFCSAVSMTWPALSRDAIGDFRAQLCSVPDRVRAAAERFCGKEDEAPFRLEGADQRLVAVDLGSCHCKYLETK